MIDIRFEGPCSDDMVSHGAIDLSTKGYDSVFVGRGETRAVAAARALGQIAESPQAHLFDSVLGAVNDSALSWNIEADGFVCSMYCIIRVSL